MINSEDNPVLLYKPIGFDIGEYPNVNKDKFLLAFMNEAQVKLLEMYGSNCIMIDSTHGINQYNFELTTIMVHDENHEGLPFPTLFSSRTSTVMMYPFLNEIKKRLPGFKTKIIMTDDTSIFINAWEQTFDDNPKHLLCSGHIFRSWSKNINSKIKNADVKEKVKEELKCILTEIDCITFDKMVKDFKKNI